jgi:hypothetical protein
MAQLGMTPKLAAAYKRLARESPVLHWLAVMLIAVVLIVLFVILQR